MVNYSRYKNVLLKGIYSFWLFSIVANGGGIMMVGGDDTEWYNYLEGIKKLTHGKGVFTVSIINTGECNVDATLILNIANHPLGYKGLESVFTKLIIRIEANETITMELPVPFLSPQREDDIEQYDNTDNLLPIPKNSEVIIEIRNLVDEWDFDFEYVNSREFIESRRFKKVFKTKYLEGTRLVELPSEVKIPINYDPIQSPDSVITWTKGMN